MTIPTRDDLLSVWSSQTCGYVVGDPRDDFAAAVLDRLADALPVDAGYLAAATGLELSQVRQRIVAAAEAGFETRDGAIVGAALTLNPTPHQFTVRGHDLHTWCGFDALFLPILLAERAAVRSTCPVTGEVIRGMVEPDGSAVAEPSTTQVGVVGPDVISCCQATGPDSEVCTQMPFLSGADAGDIWLQGRNGVAVVDLADATKLAKAYAGPC